MCHCRLAPSVVAGSPGARTPPGTAKRIRYVENAWRFGTRQAIRDIRESRQRPKENMYVCVPLAIVA